MFLYTRFLLILIKESKFKMIDLFLLIIGIAYLVVASYNDIRYREVPNWLCFSLITIVLVYRLFFSIYNSDLGFFIYGLVGLGIFVAIGYGFYYGRIFAGGDTKLMFGLGALLPASSISSLSVLVSYIFLLLISGGIYGIIYSFFLALGNKKEFSKEFMSQLKIRRKFFIITLVIAVISLIIPYYTQEKIFLIIPAMIFILPWLYVYAKSVEEKCLVKEVPGNKLTVGDWLYQDTRVKGKIIKPYWEGLSEKQVSLLKNLKKVKIKHGIPFVPAFLIAFVLLISLNFDMLGFLFNLQI